MSSDITHTDPGHAVDVHDDHDHKPKGFLNRWLYHQPQGHRYAIPDPVFDSIHGRWLHGNDYPGRTFYARPATR